MNTYIITTFILALSSYLYLRLAIKFKIIDKPNERSSHTKVTLRGGGIIFPIAILLFFFFNDYQFPYFVLGILLVSFVSFLDDIYTLSIKIRFPFQLIAMFLVLFEVGLPFEPIYIFAFYLITGVAVINVFNFMDGINGLTGVYSLVVLSGLFFINVNEHLVNKDLILFSIIALLVFGFYNFRKKALFFAGDIGSISIGMLIFFIGFYFTYKLSSPLISLLVIVYGADAGCTLIYRKFFTNESILDPHRQHIYQKMVDIFNVSHIKVTMIFAFLQLLVNFIIYKTYTLKFTNQLIVFFSLILFFIVSYILVFRLINIKKNQKMSE